MQVPIRFGPFQVYADNGELLKNGNRVKLSGQAIEVLLLLLDRPGRVLAREELQKRLWPGATFGDFEHGLNSAVNRLREVLGDSASHPKYIETIPRRGYRFIGSLETVESLSGASAAGSELKARFPWWSAAIVVAAFLLIGALGIAFVIGRSKDSTPKVSIVQFTSLPGNEFDPSFSPDGTQIVFAAATENRGPDIFVKTIGDEKVLRLTDAPGTSSCPEWSPDGRTISYSHRVEVGPGKFERAIFTMTPLGGAQRKLRQVADLSSSLTASCFSTWSPDATLLAYNDTPPGEPPGIFVTTPDGSAVRRLSSPPSGMFDSFPALSPDGKALAFLRNTDDGGTPTIYISSTRTTYNNAERKVVSLRGIGRLAWTADSKRIIFHARGFFLGESGLYSVSARGGPVERFQSVSSNASGPAISRQGDKLAYSVGFLDSNVWQVPLKTFAPPTSLIASTRIDMQGVFSPDGQKLLFVSNRDGTVAVWLSNADGSDPVRFSTRGGATPEWSPDGKYVAFDSNQDGRWQVFVKAVEGGPEVPLVNDGFDHRAPSWSADGKSVYFSSNRSGAWEIWRGSVQDHQATEVTHSGGTYAQEARDGRTVYYQQPLSKAQFDPDQMMPEIWSIPTGGGPEKIIFPLNERFQGPGLNWFWRVVRNGIYFVDNSTRPKPTLKYFDFKARAIRKVRHLEKRAWGAPGLGVSPGEATLLITQIDDEGGDIMLLENFR